jgi:hypothetical protein
MTNKYYDFVSPYPDKSLAVQAIKNVQQAANSQIHLRLLHMCVFWGGGGGGPWHIINFFNQHSKHAYYALDQIGSSYQNKYNIQNIM